MDTSARASASIPDGSGASPPALPHGRGLRSASAGALTARDNLGTASLEAAGRRDFTRVGWRLTSRWRFARGTAWR